MLKSEIDFDPACDPAAPIKIKYDDIMVATRRIVGAVIKTPCNKSNMSEKLGLELYLKQEFLQYTGSFKERGVVNALNMLDEDQKKNGVITATLGNHGQAISYHCSNLGIPCIVVMPKTVHMHHVMKTEGYGAKVLVYGATYKEATNHALAIGKEKKMTFINGFDHPNVIGGQGTIGIEIVEQVPGVNAVLIPCGGGGLLTGVAIAIKHIKPDTEIYGVETEKTCTMVETLRKNDRINIEIDNTIADCLAFSTVGANSFYNLKGIVDKMVVVKEDWVARAMLHLVEEDKFVIEGGAAVGVAAVMAGLFPNLKGKKVVCILTGGNVDLTILSRALERGMSSEGRLVKFKVTVVDQPGSLADLFTLLSEIGVVIKDCIPERTWVKGDVFSVEMKLLCETRNWEHVKELQMQIKKSYKEHYFQDQGDSTRPEKCNSARRGPCLAPNPVCMQK